MPTENRSSNTEIVSVPRELAERIQLRLDHAASAFKVAKPERDQFRTLLAKPAPQPHAEPIAWMVGTAFWWTKEEADRDAAATGLPMIPVGPLSSSAEADQLREVIKHSDAQIMRQSMRTSNQRAQLAERDAQLDSALDDIEGLIGAVRHYNKGHQLHNEEGTLRKYRAALSASAEPSQDHVVEADEMVRLEEHVCKGANELGNACGRCRRCIENAWAR